MAPSLTVIDPDGDLTLVVGDPSTDAIQSFQVCRRAVMRASPAWRALLSNDFIESTQSVIPLPGDSPDAMHLVLQIAHASFDNLPKPTTREKLSALMILVDKYGLHKLMLPFIKTWRSIIGEGRYRDDSWPTSVTPDAMDVWIPWTLGLRNLYTSVLIHIMCNLRLQPPESDEHGAIRFYPDTIVSLELPDNIKGILLAQRKDARRRRFGQLKSLLDRAIMLTACCCDTTSQKCSSYLLGSLINEFHQKGLYPIPIAADYALSTTHLQETLRGVKIKQYNKDHKACADYLVSRLHHTTTFFFECKLTLNKHYSRHFESLERVKGV